MCYKKIIVHFSEQIYSLLFFSSVQFEEEIKGIGLKKDVVVFALFTFLFFLTPGIFILKF